MIPKYGGIMSKKTQKNKQNAGFGAKSKSKQMKKERIAL